MTWNLKIQVDPHDFAVAAFNYLTCLADSYQMSGSEREHKAFAKAAKAMSDLASLMEAEQYKKEVWFANRRRELRRKKFEVTTSHEQDNDNGI